MGECIERTLKETEREREREREREGQTGREKRTARKLQLIEIVCLPTNVMSDNEAASICQD